MTFAAYPKFLDRFTFKLMMSLSLVLFWDLTAFAQGPTKATKVLKQSGTFYIGKSMDILEDAEGKLTFADVIRQEAKLPFQPGFNRFYQYGLTESVYWFRVTIKNKAASQTQWRLEVNNPLLSRVELHWLEPDGSHHTLKAGSGIPFNDRPLLRRSPVFPIEIPHQADRTYYLKIQAKLSLVAGFTISSGEMAAEKDREEQALFGFHYGVLLVLLLYHVLLFWVVREEGYLHYLLFLSSAILIQLSVDGFAFQWLWPELPTLNDKAPYLIVPFVSIFLLNICIYLLQIKEHLPKLHQFLQLQKLLFAIFFVFVVVNDHTFQIVVIRYLGIVMMISTIVASAYRWRQGQRTAKYLLVSWIIFFIGVGGKLAYISGIHDQYWANDYGFHIAAMVQAFLIALALVDQINQLRLEKEKYAGELGVIYKNLTEEVRKYHDAEEGLNQYRQLLEDRVADRTQQLKMAQAQLIQASKMASLGEMATGIAHELNQPLMIIEMNAEMGLEEIQEGNEESAKRFLTKIIDQVLRSTAIVDRLKMFGYDYGKNGLKTRDLNQIVSTSLETLEPQLAQDYIKFQKQLTDSPLKLECDAWQLEQVLTNLLINARDAMEEQPEKSILVKTLKKGSMAIIQITDNGPGMPQDLIEKIFDPFFTTKEVGKGTGLGLSICYNIIRAHQGEIKVESIPGQGTTFYLHLPLSSPSN